MQELFVKLMEPFEAQKGTYVGCDDVQQRQRSEQHHLCTSAEHGCATADRYYPSRGERT